MPDDVRRVLTVLGCLASDPGLGGALLFDLDPVLLAPLALWMAEKMPSARPRPIANVGALQSVDELWCRTSLDDGRFTVDPGLAVEEGRIAPPILLIPDLMRLRPMAARVAVSLIGAQAAVAQVADRSVQWRPRGRWLAAAERAESRRLSPHLLDRFMLRVDAARLHVALMPDSWLAAWSSAGEMMKALVEALRQATPAGMPARLTGLELPPLSAEAAARVVALLPRGAARRELAVARVARVLAAWETAREVTAGHVDRSAELLGHRRPDQPRLPAAAVPPLAGPPPAAQPDLDDVPAVDGGRDQAGRPWPPPEAGPARPVGEALSSAPDAVSFLYPEDSVPSGSDLGLFRAGRLRPRPETRRVRGPAVGSLPARGTSDLAVLATVLEAAKFRRIRRGHRLWSRRLVIIPADLRRPRYASDPRDALVMVLDHSCWRGWDRAAALAPYLRRSAQRDASVSVIEFGFKGARSELAAERYRVPALDDPRILVSLNRSPGRASPLAHALELALADLRRLIRRAVPPQHCLLVVATDGRGNVPLDASVLGRRPRPPVERAGITDAERVAERIGALRGVEIVVLAPDHGPYRELPFDLADGFGGAQVMLAPRATPRMRGTDDRAD
jgi:magnesium chelatase subunit D